MMEGWESFWKRGIASGGIEGIDKSREEKWRRGRQEYIKYTIYKYIIKEVLISSLINVCSPLQNEM